MSTPQTDSYWRWQQDIVEDYAEMVKAMKDPALSDALKKIVANGDIHEATKRQCRALYSTWRDATRDKVWEEQDCVDEYAHEREVERAESHNAPSEGFER